jgi:rhodanese-related sulfurtransferase
MDSNQIALLVAGLLIAWMILQRRGNVSPAEARRLVAEEGARLLDVRTPVEFASGHLDGARDVPVQELSGRLDEVGPKDVPVVVYCRSGARSPSAAKLLRASGFARVVNLGAMTRW